MGSYQNLLEEKHVSGSPSELPEGTNLLTTQFQILSFWNCERINLCWLMSSSLWYFVIAATRNSYIWHETLKKSGGLEPSGPPCPLLFPDYLWRDGSHGPSSASLFNCTFLILFLKIQLNISLAQWDFSPGNLPYSLLTKEGWPLCEDELFFAKELPLWESSDKIATSFLLSEFSLYQHLKWPLWEKLVLLGKQNEHLFCQLP